MKKSVHHAVLAAALGLTGLAASAVEAPPAGADTFPSRLVRQMPKPEFPRALIQDGVIKGRVRVSANVDQTGHVTDALALAYSHPRLAEESLRVLRQWEFQPARLHGVPISTVVDLAFEYEVDGPVLIHETPARMFEGMSGLLSDRYVYQLCPPKNLDRQITAVRTVQPAYSKKLRDQKVTGRVVVQFFIDEAGKPRLPAVVEGDNDELVAAATTALQQWQFEPPTSHGAPVLACAVQEFNFGM